MAEDVQVEIARLKAELAAKEAQAGGKGVLTVTTAGNGSTRLVPVGDSAAVTDEQKRAEEMAKLQENAYANAAESAEAEAKAQAEARAAQDKALKERNDQLAKAEAEERKANEQAAKAAAKA